MHRLTVRTVQTFLLCCTILSGFTALTSCRGPHDDSLESSRFFYFDALAIGGGGKMYVYEAVNNPMYPNEIWHRRFSGAYRGNHLYNVMYTPEMEVQQRTIETISKTGAVLIDMELYALPDTEAIPVQINEPTTFLFGPPDTTVAAKYQIEYREPGPDSIRVILTRLRRFADRETYQFDGKEYPALRYTVYETLETQKEGYSETTWNTTEIYARGLGLVYYKKEINPEFVLEYRLKEAVPYELYMQTHEQ